MLVFNSLLLPHRPRFDMEYYCKHIIVPNRHRMISLRNLTSSLMKALFTQCVLDESFSRLENLTFYRVLINEILPILPYLKFLPRLSSLTISIDDFNDVDIDLHGIYRVIFVLPTLKYVNINLSAAMLTDSNTFETNGKFSSIEYLTMAHSCTLNGLTSILKHTHHLRHLTCGSLYGWNDAVENDAPLMLPNLTYFWIYYCTVPFDEFERFIKKSFSQLHVFRINTFSNENYLDPDRWRQLILLSMPRLRRFHFTYDVHWNADFVDHHFESFVYHFSSPFWVQRDFMVEIYVTSGRIQYSFRSNSFDYTERKLKELMHSITASNQSIHYDSTHAPIHLSIVYQDDPWSVSFMNSASFILSAIPITNLFIGLHKMPVSLFIKIIRFLPNLKELRVPELSLDELTKLSIEEEEDLRNFSIRNQVTNVYHSAERNLTTFLISLCPRMKYLEISCVSNTNVETFVRFVLLNSIIHTPDLHLMKIWICKANDQMVRQLKNLIDSEKLLSNYIIQRWSDHIIIKWDLE